MTTENDHCMQWIWTEL